MFLVLSALILRPVGFMFRNKLENPAWRNLWDWALFVGGFAPALVFGVAFGNLLLGVPFHFDADLRVFYEGGFFGLLNPFGVLSGLVSVAMLVLHGATYAALRSGPPMADRAIRAARLAALAFVVLFSLAGLLVATRIAGFSITSLVDTGGPSNPLHKTVTMGTGLWLSNYSRHPWMLLAPIAAYCGAAGAFLLARRFQGMAFIASAIMVAGTICTAGFSAFPFLLPSSLEPGVSLTVWDASSSRRTLALMSVAALIFIPVVLAYTSWVYRVLRGKVTLEQLHKGAY
jgi:cytochrome d ubiquinol oxidase subunit II